MPLSFLLGSDPQHFSLSPGSFINPNNWVLIGIRSFEEGERALLDKLGVWIFYMEEVQTRGLKSIFKEAMTLVQKIQTTLVFLLMLAR